MRRLRFRKIKQKKHFVKFDVKIKRDSLRLIKLENLRTNVAKA